MTSLLIWKEDLPPLYNNVYEMTMEQQSGMLLLLAS